jgi:hypothetical protein
MVVQAVVAFADAFGQATHCQKGWVRFPNHGLRRTKHNQCTCAEDHATVTTQELVRNAALYWRKERALAATLRSSRFLIRNLPQQAHPMS